MFISKLKIQGFRNFKDSTIELNDGINVIIGPNNSGKTNLIKAIALFFYPLISRRLSIDDFYKNVTIDTLKNEPPRVSIQIFISQSANEENYPDDLPTVSTWLTKLDPPYEALLTYEFFLPEKEKANYLESLKDITEIKKAWTIINTEFIKKYTYKIFGGDPKFRNSADSEALQKFDFQFLDAIRDVERDMFTGRNTLLREVLDFFLDYEIKKDATKNEEEKTSEIKLRTERFSIESEKLIGELQARMVEGKKQILSYAEVTGASFNKAKPNFEGLINETDLFAALKLIIEYETGLKIPATHNGLGYNNLIYMSLLLAKMQVDSDGSYLGSNAKVFPVLAIEEPEAHLHPSMQYKFLKFLRENKDRDKRARQIFITTHSTNLTAAVALDELICLHPNNEDLSIGYPGKVFASDDVGKKSKAYVQRFLDATKSDMLFAQKVILVEGLSEQILIPVFAKYLGKNLEDEHITVINVGGRYFEHFLRLFDSPNSHTIPKKIACVTDRDPEAKKKSERSFKKIYPFELHLDDENDDYKVNASDYIDKYQSHNNIRFFSQDPSKGKTFEYDIVLHNPGTKLILTDSLSNKAELEALFQMYNDQKTLAELIEELRSGGENNKIIAGITANTSYIDEEKKKALLASRFLNSLSKGEYALELAYTLEKNISSDQPAEVIEVPVYIKEAIEWVWQ